MIMNTLKFKTNINCMGCVKSVTPHLEKAEGVKSWNVDINNPEKTLTVETDELSATEVESIVRKAGFTIEAQ